MLKSWRRGAASGQAEPVTDSGAYAASRTAPQPRHLGWNAAHRNKRTAATPHFPTGVQTLADRVASPIGTRETAHAVNLLALPPSASLTANTTNLTLLTPWHPYRSALHRQLSYQVSR